MKKKNLYEILSIPESATGQQVRDALAAAERSVVAATSNEAAADAENKVKFARQAFAVLGNPSSRSQYDQRLKRERDLAVQITAATSEHEVSAAYARHSEDIHSVSTRSSPNERGPADQRSGPYAAETVLGDLRSLATDPVGKLHSVYESLGAERAAGLGAAFAVVMSLCITFGVSRYASQYVDLDIEHYAKGFALAAVPFVAMSATILAITKLSGAESAFSKSVFIAGTALLPIGILTALSTLLGPGNIEVIAILAVFASCLGTLIVFAGFNDVFGFSYRRATWIVPVIYCFTVWISKTVYTSIIESLATP
jgi:hypothetical protein